MATTDDNWTLVIPRRRRHHQKKTPNNNSKTLGDEKAHLPLPWTPTPTSPTSPTSLPSLLRKIHRSIAALESSAFRRRFLAQLRLLRLPHPRHLVVYGVGSVAAHEPPRLQLALALLLHNELNLPRPPEIFDPVLSSVECAAVEAVGCRVMPVDESGRRVVEEPTIFYMPHCEAGLYDALLEVNWGVERLEKMVVLGNSFGEYESFVSGMGKGSRVDGEARFVVRASGFVEEVRIDRGEEEKEDGIGDGDSFFKAFNLTSWHLFRVGGKGGELGVFENGIEN